MCPLTVPADPPLDCEFLQVCPNGRVREVPNAREVPVVGPVPYFLDRLGTPIDGNANSPLAVEAAIDQSTEGRPDVRARQVGSVSGYQPVIVIMEMRGESLALQRGDESDMICSKPRDVTHL